MRALWLPDILRDAGLNVVERPGWQTRGGELTAIEGIVNHHTASPKNSALATNLAVVETGNSVAPGPIAQLLLWRDGTIYVIAAGRANHAGAGGPWGWLPLSPAGQLSVANARCLGIEAVNDGVGEPWAPQMIDAYLTADAAILRHLHLPADRVLTHHEWAPTRKIDPAGPTGGIVARLSGSQIWDGDAWRALIARRPDTAKPPIQTFPATPAPAPTPHPGDDPMITNKETRTFAGQSYPPGKIFWFLEPSGVLRHITNYGEVLLRGGDLAAAAVPNATLDLMGA